MGLLLIFAIIIITVGLDLIFSESAYWRTLNNDIRGLGVVAGVVLMLEVWGLIPHSAKETSDD